LLFLPALFSATFWLETATPEPLASDSGILDRLNLKAILVGLPQNCQGTNMNVMGVPVQNDRSGWARGKPCELIIRDPAGFAGSTPARSAPKVNLAPLFVERKFLMWEVYCDESRITRCKFMLIGALTVPPTAREAFSKADAAFRNRTSNNQAHFKWLKACGTKKLPSYLGLVDLFFDHDIRFKCLIVETSKVDYKAHHQGDPELGFYKFYFLLLSRLISFDNQHIVRIHRRPDKNRGRLSDLQSATNNWCRRQRRKNITPIASIDAADYRDHTELQIVDVLLGAIGYHWERCHLKDGASHSKIEICNAICKRLEKASLVFESDWREQKFNLWKWLPKKMTG
jgi:hypothetical protein